MVLITVRVKLLIFSQSLLCSRYREMKVNEAGEKKEMVDIYMEKGMTREDATAIIDLMAKYQDLFIDTMMVDELGLRVPDEDDNPCSEGI